MEIKNSARYLDVYIGDIVLVIGSNRRHIREVKSDKIRWQCHSRLSRKAKIYDTCTDAVGVGVGVGVATLPRALTISPNGDGSLSLFGSLNGWAKRRSGIGTDSQHSLCRSGFSLAGTRVHYTPYNTYKLTRWPYTSIDG